MKMFGVFYCYLFALFSFYNLVGLEKYGVVVGDKCINGLLRIKLCWLG